jgi:hypothetical protein
MSVLLSVLTLPLSIITSEYYGSLLPLKELYGRFPKEQCTNTLLPTGR